MHDVDLDYIIRPLTSDDYESCIALWRSAGIEIRPGDERAGFDTMLARNPGLCLGVVVGEQLVGCVLGGWDGRRGWIHHLAIHPSFQRRGLGRCLLRELEKRFASLGAPIVNLLVVADNHKALAFYEQLGYRVKSQILCVGKTLPSGREPQ